MLGILTLLSLVGVWGYGQIPQPPRESESPQMLQVPTMAAPSPTPGPAVAKNVQLQVAPVLPVPSPVTMVAQSPMGQLPPAHSFPLVLPTKTPSAAPQIVSPPQSPPVRPTPLEKSLEQLLDELQALQAQKAELSKKEQELARAIKQKSDRLTERMKQLGIAAPAATDSPPRVGRILIEGNEKTADGEILSLLELSPGECVENPKLDKARARLAKVFDAAAVELLPKEKDSVYVDVLVRVTEK
jgi:hypothetical protein